LLDRDGTIVVEKHYLKSIDQLELLPDAVEGLRMLAAGGFGLIVISNQSGVGRGLVTVEEVEAIHAELRRRLAAQGVEIAAIYYCPHSPAEHCGCRKPLTELAEQASKEFGFNLAEAVVIGDKTSDIEFGRAIGARTILVRTGYGREHEPNARPDAVVNTLREAARLLSGSGPSTDTSAPAEHPRTNAVQTSG
jgi:D-glycero-D-manno-heptose 1,7-bisphosphate phosphatase